METDGLAVLNEADAKSLLLGSVFFFSIIFSPFIIFLVLMLLHVIVEVEDLSSGDFRYVMMQWLGAFSVAAGFSALGVWTSFLSRRKNLLEPTNIKFGYNIILSYLLGCVLGCIFLGNFLSGNLFPELSQKPFITSYIHMGDWAKIMIWCFISGFSERLIPNFLDNLVSKFGESSQAEKTPA